MKAIPISGKITLQEARIKLEQARKKQRQLGFKINYLRQFIIDKGGNPDAPKVDLVPRNRSIYIEWKKGKSFTEIAQQHNLSTTRITFICHRIEKILELKKIQFNDYKELLPYRNRINNK
jgi:DNA-binding CsgD family transcriptional regulator